MRSRLLLPMRELPTGTVTFLFTDIEGSTRLLAELGDRYPPLLDEHHRLLRAAFGRHGGIEVETAGDSFFIAFSDASAAAAAAAEAQEAPTDTGLRVRMGIHTGEPVVANTTYVGLDVHRAARVMSAGHGGQVLISRRTRDLLDDAYELLDLGEHRLKDLDEPLQLFQLGRDEFPALRSLDQARLPTGLEPILGRKRELAAILRLLTGEKARAVTIIGAGGIGKTRLATEAAQELVESYRDGVTFIELAAIRDPALVLPAIGEALGVEGDVLEQIAAREQLLVLDNLEQVVDAAPEIARLLAAAPRLAVLATSREPLRIAGERTFQLRPLAEAPAVELFRQRARAVLPDFEGEYAELAEICRRLDSLPLAIELAAARVRVLPPGQLLARLERRLPVLAGVRRDRPERQQTLRAAIEWSHDLLDKGERRLFASLAIFSGGWTLDAAEEVCGADLDTLSSLADKSLLRLYDTRFRMLATIREYARERLEEREDFADLRRRHAHFYARLAETAKPFLRGPGRDWLDRIEAEHDNFREALAWCLEDGDLDLCVRIAESLLPYWHLRAHEDEGRRFLQAALKATTADDSETTRAAGLHVLGELLFWQSEFEHAATVLDDSLVLFRRHGDQRQVVDVMNTLGNATWALGDAGRTRSLREEAVRLGWELRDPHRVARTLHYIGEEFRDLGDRAGARRAYEESIDVMRALGDKSFEMASLHGLGDLELDSENHEAAAERYRESLALALELDAPRFVVYSLAGLASTSAASGDLARAGRLWGTVEAMEKRPGLRILAFERGRYERALEAHLDDPAFRAGAAEGLDPETAVGEALSRS
jgi:predicted ATPase/class 3 adenylate cyclase